MYISGSFESVAPAEVLSLVALPTMTGALDVVDRTGVTSLFVADGKLYAVESEAVADLGTTLVERHLVSSSQLAAAAVATGDGGSVVLELLASGQVDRESLADAVHDQLVDALVVVTGKAEGHFEFRKGVRHPTAVVAYPVDSLLADAGAVEGRQDVAPAVPGPATVVRVRLELPSTLESVTLSRDEWQVVTAGGSSVSVSALATALDRDPGYLATVVGDLLERRLLTVEAPAAEPRSGERCETYVAAAFGGGGGAGGVRELALAGAGAVALASPPALAVAAPAAAPTAPAGAPADGDDEWLDRMFGADAGTDGIGAPAAFIPVVPAARVPPPPPPAPAAPPVIAPPRAGSAMGERASFAAVLRELSADEGLPPQESPPSRASAPTSPADPEAAEKAGRRGFLGRRKP